MSLLSFTEYDAFAETVRDASVALRLCSIDVPKWTLQYEIVGPLHLQPLDQRLPDLFQGNRGIAQVLDWKYGDMQMLFRGEAGQFSVSSTRACC
jgi:hypothetical protein